MKRTFVIILFLLGLAVLVLEALSIVGVNVVPPVVVASLIIIFGVIALFDLITSINAKQHTVGNIIVMIISTVAVIVSVLLLSRSNFTVGIQPVIITPSFSKTPTPSLSTLAPTTQSSTPFVNPLPTSTNIVLPTVDECNAAPPARLHSQLFGIILEKLAVYEQPGWNSEIKQQLTPYQSFRVLNDPVCADNARWFRIDYGEVQGWIVEGRKTSNSSEYFVEAVNVNAPATGGCQSNFFFGPGQGCPTMTDGIPHCDEYNTANNAAYQVFQQGIMIWLCPPDQAYVLFNDGTMRVYDGSAWWWQDLPLPPDSPGIPQRGFGGIWFNDVTNNVRNRLGNTIDREWGYNATVQYVVASSNPAQDKVLLYFSIPDFNQPDSACKIIALGINSSGRFWRYMPATTSANRCQRVFS